MSWIREIEEEEAEGELEDIYDDIGRQRGELSNIMKVHSLKPEAMESHMDLYMSIMFKDRSISRELCEMIGVAVSAENGCEYCINHHAEALDHYWKDQDKLDDFIQDFTSVDLDEQEEEAVKYAVKLTQEPSSVDESDITALTNAGYSDEQVLNIDLVTSYFNFVNRIALGLGVEFDEREMKGYEY